MDDPDHGRHDSRNNGAVRPAPVSCQRDHRHGHHPLFHGRPTWSCFRPWDTGTPAIIKNFYRIVGRYRANFFSAVPTVLSTLMDIPVGDADIDSLQYAICGAAPLSVELFKRFEAHTGVKVLEGYGLTEGACASSINPKDGERKVGSIGIRMPYQQMKVVAVDENGGYLRDAAVGEIGAIAIAGPNVFSGYVEQAHNQGIWVQDGWFNTG